MLIGPAAIANLCIELPVTSGHRQVLGGPNWNDNRLALLLLYPKVFADQMKTC